MIAKKNIIKVLILFLILHLFFWTLAPSISNINLPLDTIEALAWGSNLEWGFNKHPPFSAFAVEIFYTIFGSNDWAYYLLSQIFVVVSLIYVWKFSNEIFNEKIYSLLSVLTLSGIYYYNFTTPEFNVNVSQLPFWALTVYFFWKSINSNNRINWILFGIFSALGFLSKYLFIYILLAIFFYFILNIKIYKKFITNYLFSIAISLAILTPHFIWLFKNNFITIVYGLNRSALTNT
ncbi:glycosyltransferase family 39 protein, partial [Candidatus Pelagibacter bacterium]|nr:glycosyltransferase family 39 protein [Candidatus Pelagibacter bacterium]